MDRYTRASKDSHVLSTENALKHWDVRRAKDINAPPLPPQNISSTSARVQALMRALYDMRTTLGGLDSDARVLDVGCGQGDGLHPFLMMGFRIDQLAGLDLFADRIETAKRLTPGMDFQTGDATAMPYADKSFDIVCEQFCFCHVPDADAKAKMAREMMRVSKGFIVIHDWRAGSASRKLYGVSQARIREWFPGWQVVARYRSQLWPPIGRPLSRSAWPLYDLARAFNPLVGSWLTVLRR